MIPLLQSRQSCLIQKSEEQSSVASFDKSGQEKVLAHTVKQKVHIIQLIKNNNKNAHTDSQRNIESCDLHLRKHHENMQGPLV
jgi:hypothetical protein